MNDATSLSSLPDLATVAEAAAALRIGRRLAYRMAKEGRIPAIRFGRKVFIPKQRLIAWVEQGGPALSFPLLRVG